MADSDDASDGPSRSTSHRIAGSYRDPSGFVFSHDERIFRAIDTECHDLLRHLADSGVLSSLQARELVVQTSFVEDPQLVKVFRAEYAAYEHFLEHERVPVVTYPYEWSVSMLADAGLLTLNLQLQLLDHGYSLKDATAYNVLFVNGRPRFIDIPSIERPERQDVWFALGQFMRMFLFPLLLVRHCGWDLRSYFLASIGGREIEQVAGSFRGWQRLRPGVFFDVILPLWLQRWAERGKRTKQDVLAKATRNSDAQRFNLNRLRRKVERLANGYPMSDQGGEWLSYTEMCNYSRISEEAKKEAVRGFLDGTKPSRVLDLGCNTGDYANIAADCGAEVIAADADHDVVEALYRRLRDNPAAITPMVLDVANPSPGIGFMNEERAPSCERISADCVLALALMHHLLVSANLSMAGIRDVMSTLTKRYLVIEFVPTDDSMFERLLRFRVNLFDSITLDLCKQVFLESFDLLNEMPIAESKRTLLFFQKRS